MGRALERHPSIRGEFAYQLHERMAKDEKIVVISCDLGFGMWDAIARDYPERFFNVGASEQAGVGIAVGMALEGCKPFVYSITPFLLYRGFETLRTYIDHEKIAVRLVGSGRDNDYHVDGYSHDACDAGAILLAGLPNINSLWPTDRDQIEFMVAKMVKEDRPWFISLKR